MALTQDKATYRALAALPQQDAWRRRLAEHVEGEVRWEVVVSGEGRRVTRAPAGGKSGGPGFVTPASLDAASGPIGPVVRYRRRPHLYATREDAPNCHEVVRVVETVDLLKSGIRSGGS